MKVDLVGEVGSGGGIGNYATKLFHALNEIEDLDVNAVKPSLKLPVLSATFQNFLEIPLRVLASDADVVHLADQEKAAGLAFLPGFLLKDVVVTVHDISPYVNDYAGPVSQIVSMFYCRGLRKVEGIIAISEFTKSELVEHLGIAEEKITVVYQGVDTDYFYPRDHDGEVLEKYGIDQPYILYVGSEINRKNMEGVMKKFAELQKDNPELTLVKAGGAGRDKYRKKTRHYMEKHGLEEGEDVIFTGFVDEEDLPQVYSSAEATLLWSHYEGFGRSALESEACGTPVIAPDKPPMNEWLPENRRGLDIKKEGKPELASRSWSEVAEKIGGVYEQSR